MQRLSNSLSCNELDNSNIPPNEYYRTLAGCGAANATCRKTLSKRHNGKEFENTFAEVLAYCNELELIGGEDFAVDGLRLPSNASLEMGGTKERLEKRLEQYRKMAVKHIERHNRKDERGETDGEIKKQFEKQQKRYQAKIENISSFLRFNCCHKLDFFYKL